MVRARGHELVNADITVICEMPKITPHVADIRAHLAGVLKISITAISVKATTTEKLGFTGRGEGIAAHAVVLLEKK
jgi:2-C-methyl-D-erythritol 2,4-cyclodiphosphate synthase